LETTANKDVTNKLILQKQPVVLVKMLKRVVASPLFAGDKQTPPKDAETRLKPPVTEQACYFPLFLACLRGAITR